MNNRYMEKPKDIIKQIILNVKFSISDKQTILSILFFFVFGIVLSTIFFPIWAMISVLYFISALIPASVLFVETTFSWRGSTLYKNLTTTRVSKMIFFTASLILFLMTVFILSFVITILIFIFDKLGFIMRNWRNADVYWNLTYLSIINIPFVYSLFELSIVGYSFLLLMLYIFNSKKNLYMVIMSMLILEIIFGALFNDYYDIFSLLNGTDDYYFEFGVLMLPKNMFWPTAILFPFYGPSQHLQTMEFPIKSYYSMSQINWFYWIKKTDYFTSVDNIIGSDANRWNFLWFIPYIHTTLFLTITALLSKLKK